MQEISENSIILLHGNMKEILNLTKYMIYIKKETFHIPTLNCKRNCRKSTNTLHLHWGPFTTKYVKLMYIKCPIRRINQSCEKNGGQCIQCELLY